MKQKFLLLIVTSLLVAACGGIASQPAQQDEVEESSAQDKTDMEEEVGAFSSDVDKFLAGTNITADGPGGAVMVIQGGRIVHQKGYGLADMENGEPITTNTVFHLGSVSKQFTALGVMILAERGEINYDDPIGTYIPELEWLGEEVTIRRLLHHTSGIPDYYELDELYEALLAISEQPSNEDVITVLSEESDLMYEPGSEYLYSNTGYDVLGALIERISGKPYAEFVEENIFAPLGMKNTFAVPNEKRLNTPNVSQSYMDDNGEPYAYEPDPLDGLNGAGSTYSNLPDMLLYDQALYTNGLLSQDALAMAFEPALLSDGTSTEYGFAWEVGEYSEETYYAHSGSWLGFASYYVRFPGQGLSVVMLFNLDYLEPDEETLAFQIADLYLK